MSGQLDLFAAGNQPEIPDADAFLHGLNECQCEAVTAPINQALQVLAGAGTGKTELISRRFVKLIRDLRAAGIPRPEERILVVTFTNDAAQAMRERIQRRLAVDGGDDAILSSDLWVSTFHQFCMRFLRAHPLEVGLPPDFSMLNALEQQVLFNRVVSGVLVGDAADIGEALAKADLAHAVPSDVVSLENLMQAGFEDVEALLDATRLFRLVNRIKTAGLSPRAFLEQATAQTVKFSERLTSLPVPHDPDASGLENMEAKISAWHVALQPWAHADWNPLGDAQAKADEAGKKLTPAVCRDELKALASLYLRPKTFEPETPDFTLLDQALALELKLIPMIAAIYALYQDALLRQGACDFDDLINHTVQVLQRNLALRERYRNQFEAIIVDEFQDSNGSQLALLELLMRDGTSNLTVVGDEKQSIYAFRFAQPENLDLIFRHGTCQRVSLQTNYRSRPPVLAVANRLTDQITVRANQHLQACEANAAQAEPLVTWLDLDEQLEDEKGKLSPKPVDAQKACEAQYIGVEIARLVREGVCRFSDIAVLVKSHAKADEIQQVLTALNIPSVRQKNLGFFHEPVIKDALALLRLMQDLHHDASLVRVLQGKLNQKQVHALMTLRHACAQTQEATSLFETCRLLIEQPERLPNFPQKLRLGLADLIQRLLAVRKMKSRLSPVQLFLRLAREIGLIDHRAPEWRQKRQRITLNTLERLLYLFSHKGVLQPTLDEVLEVLDQYAADPSQELPVAEELSGEDAVRIMTVFAAKGLEFPVVFAAYTEKAQVGRGGDAGALLFDPQYAGKAGFGLILGNVNGLPNPKREVYQKCWQYPRSRTEAQRVFYVALTRAMQRLYVIRGSQSFAWTAPDVYPASAVQVLSETRDADWLSSQVWECDLSALAAEMATLQEPDALPQ